MKNRQLVVGLALLLAVLATVPALAGSVNSPSAGSAHSTKLAQKTLAQAKRALKASIAAKQGAESATAGSAGVTQAAGNAQSVAAAAQGTASAAAAAAAAAQTVGTAAKGTAEGALTSANGKMGELANQSGTTVVASKTSGGVTTSVATCPAGKVPTGGQWAIFGNEAQAALVIGSAPNNSNGWVVEAVQSPSFPGLFEWELQASVMCAVSP